MRIYDALQLVGLLIVSLGLAIIWYPLGILALGGIVFLSGLLMEKSKGGVNGAVESSQ
jgi:hypothetical protein